MRIHFDVPDLEYAKEIAELILDAAAEHDFNATEAWEKKQKLPQRPLSPRRKESLLHFYRSREAEQNLKAEVLHQAYKSITEQIRKMKDADLT